MEQGAKKFKNYEETLIKSEHCLEDLKKWRTKALPGIYVAPIITGLLALLIYLYCVVAGIPVEGLYRAGIIVFAIAAFITFAISFGSMKATMTPMYKRYTALCDTERLTVTAERLLGRAESGPVSLLMDEIDQIRIFRKSTNALQYPHPSLIIQPFYGEEIVFESFKNAPAICSVVREQLDPDRNAEQARHSRALRAAEGDDPTKEANNCSVVVLNGKINNIDLVKAIRSVNDMELADIRGLMKTMPFTLAAGVTRTRAEEIKVLLCTYGASVRIDEAELPEDDEAEVE